MNNYELHAIIKGRVQGVGFRWTLVDHAKNLNLTGSAQNLSDGSVEVYVQGEKEALESFLIAVKEDPGFARITSISSEYRKPQKVYNDFRIVH